MTVLAESVDAVIGVDTHRDTLSAAVVTPIGAVVADHQVAASAAGYRTLLEFGRVHVPGMRCWALEGAGSYGAGFSAFLSEQGERVVEVARPKRPTGQPDAKATASTRSAPPGKPSAATTRWCLEAAANAKPSVS